MEIIWCVLFLGGTGTLLLRQGGEAALAAMTAGAQQAVTLSIALGGGYLLWMGLLQVAKKAGLMERLSRIMQRPIRFLMPGIGREAAGAVALNFAANMLGMGSAATPFGLEAVRLMQRDNPNPERATDAMCTFLCINTSSLQLIPTTLLALRGAAGCARPAAVVLPGLLASAAATLTAVALCRWLTRKP